VKELGESLFVVRPRFWDDTGHEAEDDTQSEGALGMDENKDLARRIYEEVINKRDLDLLDELVTTGYIEHDPLPGQREGIDGIRDRFRMLIDGLDAHFTIEDLIAEGDRVVVRWTNSGTNVGEFFGAPATNRPFTTAGIDIYRVEDGKLAEHWHVVDVYGQMVQLGQLPAPGGA
jgi:predicted ester cyclase